MSSSSTNNGEKSMAAAVSVASNTALVLFKIGVGLAIGSVSVLSEAIHSGVDLVASCIAWAAVKLAGKPADHEHPFGHGKWENISGTVEALLIFVAAGWIAFEAIKKLTHSEPLENPGWGVAVMALSALVNQVVSAYLFRVGSKTDSLALQADAWHLRTDVYTSAGVMLGLGVMWGGAFFFPGVNLGWVDPVAALLVAILIVKAAWELTVQSGQGLLDARLPEAEESRIAAVLESPGAGICGYHDLRTRKSGPDRFVEVHLELPAHLTVGAGHDIAHGLSVAIKGALGSAQVQVHVDPCRAPDCACRRVESRSAR